ncbi:MAG: hypothetical protein GF401_11880 [Chitinivibrionales bacterium]|nr:hypothetical protein [Chitinivibrionales bacterium]
MKKILVNKIEDKMVLAKEVRGRSGNVLLRSGTVLSAPMGRRLKNWDIHFVYVEGEEENAPQKNAVEISPEKIEKQMKERFSKVMNNPTMKEIFAAVYQHRVKKNS